MDHEQKKAMVYFQQWYRIEYLMQKDFFILFLTFGDNSCVHTRIRDLFRQQNLCHHPRLEVVTFVFRETVTKTKQFAMHNQAVDVWQLLKIKLFGISQKHFKIKEICLKKHTIQLILVVWWNIVNRLLLLVNCCCSFIDFTFVIKSTWRVKGEKDANSLVEIEKNNSLYNLKDWVFFLPWCETRKTMVVKSVQNH